MTADQWLKIPLEGLDAWTLAEIRSYVERKLDDHQRLRGQIARDLNRIGEMAFLDPSAYDKLKAKYKARSNVSRKKLAVLDLMQKEQCKCETQRRD